MSRIIGPQQTADLFTRVFLGIFFLLIGILYSCRIVGQHQRDGQPLVHYGVKGSATWWHRHCFNLFRAAILGVCLVRIVAPIDSWLGRFDWLYHPIVLLSGVALLLLSFARICYIQGYLSLDWRTGIDENRPPPLLTTGPYARQRHPTFAAIIVGQCGFFLAFPSWFSLVCLLVGAMVIIRQASAEDTALERLHGEAYRTYRERVSKWI